MLALSPQSTLQQGKYIIQRVLGQGGFGITYEGLQTGLNRRVAIKEFFMCDSCERSGRDVIVVGTEGSRQQVSLFREKFVKEAQLIATLDQAPHVVRIYDIFEENQTAYYVMDFIEGGSLDDLVRREGPLDEARAVDVVSQAAEALDVLHQRQTMHLDVKPSNILLRRDQQGRDDVVLIDFGVSKHYDGEGRQTTSTPVGLSKGFAPLEQYREGGVSAFSPATDVYSLGATLYYLISGNIPPEAADLLSTSLSRPAGLSSTLWQVIRRSMAIRPADRYQSMGEMLYALSAVSLSLQKTAPKPKQKPTPKPKPSPDTLLHDDAPTIASADATVAADPSSTVASADATVTAPNSSRQSWVLPAVCSLCAVILVLTVGFILTRPKISTVSAFVETDSISQDITDMMLVLDVSASMQAEDFEPNRLTVAKNALSSMIDSRPDDRIGLVLFAGEALTMTAPAEDHANLRYMLYHKTDCTLDGAIEDGTAIGDALACALNQLKDSKAANRVVVLLTDGTNNYGEISPQTAASMAEVLGVRVYIVALGTKGMARYPLRDGDRIKYIQIPTEVDSASLCPIAERTHGCFYQTDNVDVLHKIYDIDLAEEMGIFPDTDPSAVSPAMSREEVDRLLDAAASREEVVQMKVRVASGI